MISLRAVCLLSVLIGVIIGGCHCVKITNLEVPTTYEISNSSDADDLVLDCEFELDAKDTGFVLKWLLDDQAIYQWIPGHKPYALSYMKGRIDTSFAINAHKPNQHRALLISKPMWNMTGEYTCSVQTYESSDKETAHMQIIVPESDFQLSHSIDDDGSLNVRCSASDVYPKPELTIVIGDSESDEDSDEDETTRDQNGLYDTSAEIKLEKDEADSANAINCILSLSGTNYTRKLELILNDENVTGATEFLDNGNRSDKDNGESGANGNYQYSFLTVLGVSGLLGLLSLSPVLM